MPPSSRLLPLFVPLLSAAAPLALYLTLRQLPGLDPTFGTPHSHFVLVSVVSAVAALVAVGIGWAGWRRRNLQVQLLANAFLSLSVFFTLHGLSSPGVMMPMTHLIGVAAQLSHTLAALWLALSVLPSTHVLLRPLARLRSWLLPLWVLLLAGFGGLALTHPDFTLWLPVDAAPLQECVALPTLAACWWTAQRYSQFYRYTHFPLHLAAVFAALWVAASQIIAATGVVWHLSWWLYHGLLLGSVIAMTLGLGAQYRRRASLSGAVRGLLDHDPEALLASGISPAVEAMVRAAEQHDAYTAGHTLRVARLGLQLGRALRLPPEDLRALAQGGVLHDLGKLKVGSEILNKPGKLTDEEFAVIRQHPVWGEELCAPLGFLPSELGIVRWHHERWDGQGYPDQLSGEQIPRLARILAVADVYDALTSDRAYRAPWSPERAAEYLRSEAGRQFDPAVVARLPEVLAAAASASPDLHVQPFWTERLSRRVP